jgi:cytoskeletal protein RodZ
MILPAQSTVADSAVPAPVAATKADEKKATEPAKVATKPKETTPAAPTVMDKVSDAIGATALADDLAAIAASAEAADSTYDDGALQADVTSSEPASLTTAYGI